MKFGKYASFRIERRNYQEADLHCMIHWDQESGKEG
jgi:hypothetical protein